MAALAAASLFIRLLAHAQVFIPPPVPWYGEERARKAPPAPEAVPVPGATPIVPVPPSPTSTPPIFGVSFNFVQRSNDLKVKITDPNLGSFKGSSDVAVYTALLDAYVLGCSLGKPVRCQEEREKDPGQLLVNVGAFAGYVDGSSSVAGSRVDLHGPVLGASTMLTLIAEAGMLGSEPSPIAYVAPFLMAGFDYAATDYSKIKGWVHSYGVKPRAGLMIQGVEGGETLFLYGGASWLDFTEEQTSDQGVKSRVRSKEPAVGLVGANFTNTKGTLRNISLAVEGEVGERTGVALSLRYGFNIPP